MSDSPHRKWKRLRLLGSSEEDSAEAYLEEEEVVQPEPEPEPVSEPEPELEPEIEVPELVDEADPPLVEQASEEAPDRILVVHSVGTTMRLVRETLEHFTSAEIITSSEPLRGFELALQREYRLFLFGVEMGELSGPTLYELISKTYSTGWAPKRLAPGVIFLREPEDPKLPEEFSRDARVKAVIPKPIRIERLLEVVGESVEVFDPTSQG